MSVEEEIARIDGEREQAQEVRRLTREIELLNLRKMRDWAAEKSGTASGYPRWVAPVMIASNVVVAISLVMTIVILLTEHGVCR